MLDYATDMQLIVSMQLINKPYRPFSCYFRYADGFKIIKYTLYIRRYIWCIPIIECTQ